MQACTKNRCTAKHLTVFGLFRIALSKRRGETKNRCKRVFVFLQMDCRSGIACSTLQAPGVIRSKQSQGSYPGEVLNDRRGTCAASKVTIVVSLTQGVWVDEGCRKGRVGMLTEDPLTLMRSDSAWLGDEMPLECSETVPAAISQPNNARSSCTTIVTDEGMHSALEAVAIVEQRKQKRTQMNIMFTMRKFCRLLIQEIFCFYHNLEKS